MSWLRWATCSMDDRAPLLTRSLCALTALGSCVLLACTERTDLQVLGESFKRKQGESAPAVSAGFDGRTLRLRGVRGEVLGVQVLVDDARAQAVQLELPAGAARVDAFDVKSVTVSEPSTEMYGPSRGAGSYPDRLVRARGAVVTEDTAYFDVAIETSAAPGDYLGVLTVGERTIPVELEVDQVAINLHEDPLVWVFYHPKELARVHRLADTDNAHQLDVEARYHELFREHGAYLAADLGPERFAARRRFAEGLRYWPVAVDASNDARIEADVRFWLATFEGTETVPFAIPVDEPRTHAQKLRARHIAEVIGRAGGGRPRFLRGVTDATSPLYEDVFDVYFSPHNLPRVAAERTRKGERFWTYNGKPPGAGSMIIDTDGAALRTWGWISYRYGVELWYAWEGLYFSDRYNDGKPTDVTRDPLTFDERKGKIRDRGNGDGLLAYPGPEASLRLKALRRGLQDRLLLIELERCGGKQDAEALARRVIPQALGEAEGGTPSWPSDELGWEQARVELLDALERRCAS